MKRKMIISVMLLFVGLGLVPSVFADLAESSRMVDIVSKTDSSTLLIFDLDSTVIEMSQTLGSDAWFYYNLDKNIKTGMNNELAREKIFQLWHKIAPVSEVQLVEPETATLIKKAQDKGIKTMALTARPFDIRDATVKQLRSVGVDFMRQPVYKKELELKNMKWLYYEGILFVNGIANDKGVILNEFLKHIKNVPTKVIFVDDKKSNTEAVNRALISKGIPCYCVRYGGADERIRKYDPVIADVEMEFFGKILPDDIARTILKSRSKK